MWVASQSIAVQRQSTAHSQGRFEQQEGGCDNVKVVRHNRRGKWSCWWLVGGMSLLFLMANVLNDCLHASVWLCVL